MSWLFSLGFFLAGVACLWAAFRGKNFYAGGPGGRGSDRPREALPRADGQVMWALMGLGFLVVGVGSFVQVYILPFVRRASHGY